VTGRARPRPRTTATATGSEALPAHYATAHTHRHESDARAAADASACRRQRPARDRQALCLAYRPHNNLDSRSGDRTGAHPPPQHRRSDRQRGTARRPAGGRRPRPGRRARKVWKMNMPLCEMIRFYTDSCRHAVAPHCPATHSAQTRTVNNQSPRARPARGAATATPPPGAGVSSGLPRVHGEEPDHAREG
jgi:hypothetical protein